MTLLLPLKEDKCYQFSNLRVAQYMLQRLLKTTQFTTATSVENHGISFQASNFIDTIMISITAKIISVDLKSFVTKLNCRNCKEEIKDDEVEDGIAMYVFKMSKHDSRGRLYKIKRSCIVENMERQQKLLMNAKEKIVSECFRLTVEKKFVLEKAMIKVELSLTYEPLDNTVLSMSMQ